MGQAALTRESEVLAETEKLKQQHAQEIRTARQELEAAQAAAKFASVPRALVQNQASVAKLVGEPPLRVSALAASPRGSNQRAPRRKLHKDGPDKVGELESMVAFAAALLDDSKDTVAFAL